MENGEQPESGEYAIGSPFGTDIITRELSFASSATAGDVDKYGAVYVKLNMPQLTGTEKQISYAESLRDGAIRSQLKSVDNALGITALNSNPSGLSKTKSMFDRMNKESGSKYSDMNALVNDGIRQYAQNVTNPFTKKR